MIDDSHPDVAEAVAAIEAADRREAALRAYVQHYEPDANLRPIDVVTTYEAGDGHGSGQFAVFAVSHLSSPVALMHGAPLSVLLGTRQAYELAHGILRALEVAEVDVSTFEPGKGLA